MVGPAGCGVQPSLCALEARLGRAHVHWAFEQALRADERLELVEKQAALAADLLGISVSRVASGSGLVRTTAESTASSTRAAPRDRGEGR